MSPQDRSTRSFSEFIEKEEITHHNIKNRLFHDISIRVAKLINIVMMTAPFAVAWYAAYADKTWVRFYMRGHWLVIGLFILLYFSIGKVYDAFKILDEVLFATFVLGFQISFFVCVDNSTIVFMLA